MSSLPEMEKPRITEIQVRMDCNGCVQKIKKTLHGIKGIYDLYIDFPQQKITIIGWADPQKIAKAIKKTRKTAVICSHSEPSDDQPAAAQPSEPAPDGEVPPAAEGGAPPAPESINHPAAEPAPQAEAPKESPPPENPPQEAANSPTSQPAVQTSKPKDVEEIHVIHHHPPDYQYRHGPYGYGGVQWNPQQGAPRLIRVEPSHEPTYVTTHSYNAYKPSPYVTEYAHINRSPPTYSQYYTRPAEHYAHGEEYRSGSSGSGNITSIFSDENPNACRIV